MPDNAVNLGVSKMYPFSMAFVFTKHGTKVITGSMDRIEAHAAKWGVCHAIVHNYIKAGISKSWVVLGSGSLKLTHVSGPNLRMQPVWLRGILKDTKGRACYVLHEKYNDIVYGIWRKMPSRYIRQFDKLVPIKHSLNGPKQWIVPKSSSTKRRGGLDL